jgi:hypothetical protein
LSEVKVELCSIEAIEVINKNQKNEYKVEGKEPKIDFSELGSSHYRVLQDPRSALQLLQALYSPL